MLNRGRLTGIFGTVVLLILVLPTAGFAADRSPDQVYIDRVDVKVGIPSANGTSPVTAHVTGQVPICGPLKEGVSRQQDSTVTVTIAPRPLEPDESTCQAIGLRDYEKDFDLGRFEPGTYTLKVNDYTTAFTVGDTANVILVPIGPMLGWLLG